LVIVPLPAFAVNVSRLLPPMQIVVGDAEIPVIVGLAVTVITTLPVTVQP